MVNSSYYSSPWFITIFTNSLQSMNTNDNICEKILELWDFFLVSGWKAIFTMALYVLKENEPELLQMNFEQILNFITETPKQLLSGKSLVAMGGTPGGSGTPAPNELLHSTLKKSTQGMQHIRFTLERLETEFMTSFDISNHQAHNQGSAIIHKV